MHYLLIHYDIHECGQNVGTAGAGAGARKFDAKTDFTCQYANRSAEPPVRIELF
jgi:hypothetical protein